MKADVRERTCGAPAVGGACALPEGHNMGRADVPANHCAFQRPRGRCLLLHDWSAWSEPFVMRIKNQLGVGIDHMQRRTCFRCNKVQERVL